MTRIALGLEYDGTDFVGWQRQRNGRSVQSELEAAIGRVAAEAIAATAAGRTDAGVHASGQVVHFDTTAERSERQWLLGINSNLPDDIAVQWVRPVDERFDARRSARARRYRYLLLEGPARPALVRRRVWWIHEPLDCAAMSAAASYWLGERDFSAFRAAGCQSSTPMRFLESVSVRRSGGLIAVEVTANAFLQHMVRNMVGALVEIAGGRPYDWAAELIASRDRRMGAVTAPAAGLSLLAVYYPRAFELPASSETLELAALGG